MIGDVESWRKQALSCFITTLKPELPTVPFLLFGEMGSLKYNKTGPCKVNGSIFSIHIFSGHNKRKMDTKS